MTKRLAFLLGALVFGIVVLAFSGLMRWAFPPAQALVNGQVAGTLIVDGQVYIVISEDDAKRLVELLTEARRQNAKLMSMLEKGGCV